MTEYLFEMHAHSREVSACAHASADQLSKLYAEKGYYGIVSTNHMNSHTFSSVGLSDAPWSVKAEHFLSGYRALKEAAGEMLTVLLGMEITFYGDPNDYLVYGVTEDFVKNNGDLMALGNKAFSSLAHENGLIFVQAHPFRRGMRIVDWNILDGYEVFNGNPRHDSSNEITEHWSKLHGKRIVTSGSDFHDVGDEGTGGIFFNAAVCSNKDLVSTLKNQSYTLKRYSSEM